MVPTILLSGIYHEYVLWAPMRFVMPVLLVQFGVFGGKLWCDTLLPFLPFIMYFAAILAFLNPSSPKAGWNYFLHFGLHFGVSIMVFTYTMEFSARKICPKEENLMNTFIPRFYECFLTASNPWLACYLACDLCLLIGFLGTQPWLASFIIM